MPKPDPFVPEIDPALMGLTACTVQLFFAWRVKVLTGRIWLVLLIALFSIASCLGALASATATHFVPLFQNFTKFESVVIIWLAGAAVADVLITMSLTWHLFSSHMYLDDRRKHRTGFGATDQVIDRIISLTVQTGLLQALVAVINLILFLALTTNAAYFVFNWLLSKLYTNALLSSLNSRSRWGNQNATGTSNPVDAETFAERVSRRTNPNGTVQVYRQEHVELHVTPSDRHASDIKKPLEEA
ncbi:hypothetical protein HGRIS_000692 [Hohenbuehelia grisea]|uniref:DUF6534 domain-containing protein n=1 Tax=Hohenbuehelia grisea TaxID=104357 RepID=A0ABR3JSQ1_9AGAR